MTVDIISCLSDRARKEGWLEVVSKELEQDFGLTSCIGVEIEFYLPDDNIKGSPFPLKKERGTLQYEVDMPPLNDPMFAVIAIESFFRILRKWRSDINFHPKPFPGDYGSALHFHINLLDTTNYYDIPHNLEAGARA